VLLLIEQEEQARLLKRHLDRFPDTKVLVIGDIMMDEYIWGNVSRISPEAPVPIVEVRQATKMLGGAANVAVNMASLGAKPFLCGVIGRDGVGKEILQSAARAGLTTEGLVQEKARPTSIKTRVVAHNQQVVRFDRESRREITAASIGRILRFVERNLSELDAVVVSDYGKGVISATLMKDLTELVKGSSVFVAVDPKTGNFDYYRGVDVITPNHHEAGSFCGFDIVDEESLARAGAQLLQNLGCRSVLITQGSRGMTLFEKDRRITRIPTVARKVFDVTGAGDTVIGTFSLGLASGLDLRSAAILSNYAAGIVVGEVGTSSAKADELRKVINDGHV
jgi:D-beta-D-heptose 7-phosphate kinase/D-beta-D-heptose 1-phosphate adenosyltransferase